jgi:multimeric flavodoxin WrbA
MRILGISASGREKGICSEVVKTILETSGEPYEYISLAGRRINGCIGCTRCAADNDCKEKDDWNEIGEKMLKAEAIVFVAPNYFGTINALGHACLERTYCFRHREVFPLSGKLAVVGYVDGGEHDSSVEKYINKMFTSNNMPILATVYASGYSQCFTCGFGEDCGVGGVVERHGFLDKIEAHHYQPRLKDQEKASFEAYRAGKLLGSVLRGRKVFLA